VEDDIFLRELLSLHLKSIGVAVLEASNGHEALEIARGQEPPHLVLTDLIMPEMDGFAFLRQMKNDPCTTSIPVIVITGDNTVDTRREALNLGALDFTVKPLIVEDFLPRVRRVVA